MRRFKEYLFEGDTSAATKMEIAIVEAWNILLKDPDASAVKYTLSGNTNYVDNVFKIARDLQKIIPSKSKMVHYGESRSPLSTFWLKHSGKSQDYPKTDIYIEGTNYKFSVKKVGNSHLMSGKQAESITTFMAAQEHLSKKSPEETKKLIDDVKRFLGSLSDLDRKTRDELLVATGSEAGKRSLPTDFSNVDRRTLSRKAQKYAREIMKQEKFRKSLTDALNEFFNTNDTFRYHFVYEASSGEMKFPSSNDLSIANHFLVFDDKKGKVIVEEFIRSKLEPIFKKVSFRARWKHGTGALAIDLQNVINEEKTYLDVVDEECEEFVKNGLLLTESVTDFFKSIVTLIKRIANKLVKYAEKLIRRGIYHFYRFFEIDVEKLHVLHLAAEVLI